MILAMDTRLLGRRIESLLTLKEMTQGQLALYSGLSQSHISQIIDGKRRPRFDLVAQIARALDVSLDWLAYGQERNPEALAPDEAELLRLYRELKSDTFRELALENARNLARAQRGE